MSDACRGLGKVAWGYVFLIFDFNLGSLNVLPNWAAYLLFFSAIGLLEDELPQLNLLRPFCGLLGTAEGVDWLAVLFTGQKLMDRFFLLQILLSCVGIYFSFQLLTDLIQLAEDHYIRADSLRVCRNLDAVFQVLYLLPLPWTSSGSLTLFSLGMLTVSLLICLLIVCQLFLLRKHLLNEELSHSE